MNLKDFQCRCCGNCCRWPGFVAPTDQELEEAAALLQMDVQSFIDQYTDLSRDRSRLVYKEASDGACIFLTPENRCRIYAARPEHCRTFPYDWDVPPEMQKLCAGRRNDGQ